MQTRRRIACRRATNAGRAGTCEHKYLATRADIRVFSEKSVVELGPYLSQNSPSFGQLKKSRSYCYIQWMIQVKYKYTACFPSPFPMLKSAQKFSDSLVPSSTFIVAYSR